MTRSSLLGSWIDVAAATATAETLCEPPPAPAATGMPMDNRADVPAVGAPSSGDIPISAPVTPFDAEEPVAGAAPPQLHGRLRALRERAVRNGLVPAVAAAAVDRRPFRVPLGSLPVRVRALADWLNESFAPESLFVADDQGQALVEFRGGADLLAAASVLAEAAARARRHLPGAAGAAAVHFTLGPRQVLSLVTASTALGPWHAGLTTPWPLDEEAMLELVRSLQEAASGS